MGPPTTVSDMALKLRLLRRLALVLDALVGAGERMLAFCTLLGGCEFSGTPWPCCVAWFSDAGVPLWLGFCVGLSDVPNKNTGHPVKYEFQTNNT